MRTITTVLAFAATLGLAGPALASDHLADAANAPGADHRDFGNPVTRNPSGTSGPKASPGTVPGEGNPNSGQHRGTPSVDRDLVGPRSGGHGG